jgi:hypothetical protein
MHIRFCMGVTVTDEGVANAKVGPARHLAAAAGRRFDAAALVLATEIVTM